MTVAHQQTTRSWRSVLDGIDVLDVLALAVFVFSAIAIWTKTYPFADHRIELASGVPLSSESRKVIMLGIAAATGFLVLLRHQFGLIRRFPDPLLFAVVAWFGLTSLFSEARGLAFNRLALAVIVVIIAASLPLIFRSFQAFVGAYATAALLAIVLSFAGIILVPDLAIHTAMDATEQTLAGDWRGIFGHKNDMAPMMNQFLFVGLLLFRMKRPLWGGAIMIGAAVLLLKSGGKSGALTLPLTFVAAWAIVRTRSYATTVVVTLCAVGGLAAVTLGSIAFPALGEVTQAVLPDPTFTGRTAYWSMALQAIGQAPIFGYGYTTFFDMGVLRTFAAAAGIYVLPDHAHNGFLQLTLSAGIPGIVLALAWTTFLPLKYIQTVKLRVQTADESFFFDFLVQSWLNMLLISSLESTLFERGDPIWFGGLLAIVCLRYWHVSGGPADETRPASSSGARPEVSAG